jgi:hypothetical protein
MSKRKSSTRSVATRSFWKRWLESKSRKAMFGVTSRSLPPWPNTFPSGHFQFHGANRRSRPSKISQLKGFRPLLELCADSRRTR